MGERYTGQGEPQMHETNSPLQRLDMVKGLKNLGWALNDVGRLEACVKYVEQNPDLSGKAKSIEESLRRLSDGLQQNNKEVIAQEMYYLKAESKHISPEPYKPIA